MTNKEKTRSLEARADAFSRLKSKHQFHKASNTNDQFFLSMFSEKLESKKTGSILHVKCKYKINGVPRHKEILIVGI